LELAHGNVSAPIPYLGNYDESGEIASALAIFRENMLQADRLRKDLELALKQQAAEIVVPPLAETTEEALEDLKAEIKEEIEEDMADKIEGPGRGLIPHADNLPAEPEPQSDDGADGEPAEPQLPIGKSAITSISQQVTTTSQNASIAAEEAERTEQMVAGLDEATEKIEDIEILMIGISDQMSLLSVQTALLDGGTDAENLIHLDEKRSKKKSPAKSASGQSVSDRIETIQGGTKRAIKAAQNIGRTLNDVNETAKDFAATASKEALEAANELLRQSEDLRTLLDNLLGKVETGGNQSKAKE
jgi:methyl-accepting chemotaxis protein